MGPTMRLNLVMSSKTKEPGWCTSKRVLWNTIDFTRQNEFSNILRSCQQRYLVWAQGASRVAVWPAPTTMAACPASRDSSCIWRESGWSKSACAWLPALWAFTARAPQRETHAQVRHDTKANQINPMLHLRNFWMYVRTRQTSVVDLESLWFSWTPSTNKGTHRKQFSALSWVKCGLLTVCFT